MIIVFYAIQKRENNRKKPFSLFDSRESFMTIQIQEMPLPIHSSFKTYFHPQTFPKCRRIIQEQCPLSVNSVMPVQPPIPPSEQQLRHKMTAPVPAPQNRSGFHP